jgi:transcription elongation GreA/GreB family factor
MAYPTGVSFKHTGRGIGKQPIHETSATQLHALGEIVSATDGTYGAGEFIYLVGVASTAQGDLVVYNSKTGATTRTVAGTTKGPVGVAMADLTAGLFGWYQISGATPVKAGTVSADTDVYLTATASSVDDLVDVGDKVDGATFKAATSAGYALVQMARPSVAAESGTAGLITAQADIVTAQAAADAAQAAADALEALGRYCTLSASAEVADVITVTGQVKTLDGTNVAEATAVIVRTLAVTADKGDIAVTSGTAKEIVNPAAGENVAWLETTAAGAFVVTVTNDATEDTIITAVPDNGLVQMLKLTFAA